MGVGDLDVLQSVLDRQAHAYRAVHAEDVLLRRDVLESAKAKKLLPKLEEWERERKSIGFAGAAHALRYSKDMLDSLPWRIVEYLAREAEQDMPDRYTARAQDIGFAFYGLSKLSNGPRALRLLTALLPKTQSFRKRMSSHGASLALYGLRNFANTAAGDSAVSAVVAACRRNPAVDESAAIGMALYGGSRLNNERLGRELMAALVPHARRRTDTLSDDECNAAFEGFTRRVDSPEVREMLSLLGDRMPDGVRRPFSFFPMMHLLSGLQLMHLTPEVERVLRQAVAARVASDENHGRESGRLEPRSVGKLLYGMKSMGCAPVTRAILTNVTADIHSRLSGPFPPREVGLSVIGVQRQHSQEARKLLRALLPHVVAAKSFPESAMVMVFQGCQNRGPSAEVQELLGVLLARLRNEFTVAGGLAAIRGHLSQPEAAAEQCLAAIVPRLRVADLGGVSGAALGNTLYSLHARCSPNSSIVVRLITEALAEHSPPDLEGMALAAALFGVRSQPPVVSSLLFRALSPLVARALPTIRDPAMVSIACRGLLQNPTREARQLLALVAPLAVTVGHKAGLESIVGIMHSLHHFSDTPEWSAVMRSLVPATAGVRRMEAPNVAACLYGMRRAGPSAVTLALLEHIEKHVKTCSTFTPLQISNSLMGMVGMGESLMVQKTFAAVGEKIPSGAAFDGKCIAGSLLGISRLGSAGPARGIIHALIPCIAAGAQVLTPMEVVDALFGLRGQSEPRSILAVLVPKVLRCPGPLNVGMAATAVRGFFGFGNTPEVKALLDYFAPYLKCAHEPLPARTAANILGTLASLKHAGVETGDILASVMRRVPQRAEPSSAASLSQGLLISGAAVPQKVKAALEKLSSAPSESERVLFFLLKQAIVRGLRFNVRHASGFEMDILVRDVNVELDSNSRQYASAGKASLHRLRDGVLRSEFGITVRRVNSSGRDLADVVEELAGICCHPGDSPFNFRAWERARQMALRGWSAAWANARQQKLPQVHTMWTTPTGTLPRM